MLHDLHQELLTINPHQLLLRSRFTCCTHSRCTPAL